jgi:hypothetical protein
MNCIAQSAKTEADVAKVQHLLETMERLSVENEDEGLKPNTRAYNALIKALSQLRSKDAASRAEAVLFQLIERDDLTPDGATFINAIHAWKNSRHFTAGTKAEKLLELQEGLAMKETKGVASDLWPTVRVYNAVIDAGARSTDTGKAVWARRIFDKMEQVYLKQTYSSSGAGDVEESEKLAPNVRSYNGVLNACAFTRIKKGIPAEESKKESMEAFRVAVQTMNEIRDHPTLAPNHVSYGMFLKACANLLPPSNDKRDAVVENVFRKCAKDGHVHKFVLESLQEAASPRLIKTLLGGKLAEDISIPVEWTRNTN